jgi:hypothetical protein
MDLAWNLVFDLLEKRGLLRDGLFVERHTGIHSWVEAMTRCTVVHFCDGSVLFVDTPTVDVIVFCHDILGADDPKTFFTVPL